MVRVDGESRKGVATVRFSDGRIRLAEVHWFEAHESASGKCESNDFWIKEMARKNNQEPKFAVCITRLSMYSLREPVSWNFRILR